MTITLSRQFGAGGKTLGDKLSLENACRHICMLVQDEPQ